MIEWMEGGFGEGITLEFLKAEDIKPESLVMNDYPEIQINAVYRSVSPDTTDRIHLNEKEYNEPNDSSYIHTVLSMLPRSTRFTQASSSFQLMKDTKKAGKKYLINPNIKDTDCVVVRLGYLVKNLRMKRRSY